MLREVIGVSNREGASILQCTESVYRHKLSAARGSMRSTYEGLCALVNKQGVCRQCASFREAARAGVRGPALPVLDGNDSWEKRVRVVASSGFEDSAAAPLHRALVRGMERLEAAREE